MRFDYLKNDKSSSLPPMLQAMSQEDIYKEKCTTAKNMIQQHMNTQFIALVTELSEEEIEKIREELL